MALLSQNITAICNVRQNNDHFEIYILRLFQAFNCGLEANNVGFNLIKICADTDNKKTRMQLLLYSNKGQSFGVYFFTLAHMTKRRFVHEYIYNSCITNQTGAFWTRAGTLRYTKKKDCLHHRDFPQRIFSRFPPPPSLPVEQV